MGCFHGSQIHFKRRKGDKEIMASLVLTLSAIISILAGLLVLVWPKFLRLAIGLYLIAIGILQLLNNNLGLSPL